MISLNFLILDLYLIIIQTVFIVFFYRSIYVLLKCDHYFFHLKVTIIYVLFKSNYYLCCI